MTTQYDSQQSDSNSNSSSSSSDLLFVIKHIRKDLYPKKRIEAAKDLAREAKLLTRLQQLYNTTDTTANRNMNSMNNHPNIITIRGIASTPGSIEFGIILDRLYLTLTEISTSWKDQQTHILNKYKRKIKTISSSASSVSSSIPTSERVLALWDVSEGMKYLHKNQILFRDLKTENVGSIISATPIGGGGCVTTTNDIIDNVDKKNNNDDGAEQEKKSSTNSCHHQQHQQQYQRMQIFDFGLARECKPIDRVMVQQHGHLQNLMQQCWNDNSNERPTFNEISSQLNLILLELFYYHYNNNSNQDQKQQQQQQQSSSSPSRRSPSSSYVPASTAHQKSNNEEDEDHVGRSAEKSIAASNSVYNSDKSNNRNHTTSSSRRRIKNTKLLPRGGGGVGQGGEAAASAFWYRLEMIHSSGLLDD
ncbi:hypothetical protein FRACYDRAFT_251475 [Fragilariopsis cylindrus CCMP1102]|uniref:Protein kinase domain-containing protein n=1 Tax=Fragilariopsis cylindrus CCMP1102 TaxID=635003 RepID=A0A1E7EML1_9STRA|nr:hypothetical protein FRACYDRAFT_251475 [Fragilariopsis cylindrus CCMP1102]|eukprot:OEU07178.1 hypothetical protein FRACYDRAFT_251475 [Fragilariopsis cylindrus CCMP1102]